MSHYSSATAGSQVKGSKFSCTLQTEQRREKYFTDNKEFAFDEQSLFLSGKYSGVGFVVEFTKDKLFRFDPEIPCSISSEDEGKNIDEQINSDEKQRLIKIANDTNNDVQ